MLYTSPFGTKMIARRVDPQTRAKLIAVVSAICCRNRRYYKFVAEGFLQSNRTQKTFDRSVKQLSIDVKLEGIYLQNGSAAVEMVRVPMNEKWRNLRTERVQKLPSPGRIFGSKVVRAADLSRVQCETRRLVPSLSI